MRVGVLTSIDTRHRYVAQALADVLDVAAVGYERTGYDPATAQKEELTNAEQLIVRRHFDDRARLETEFFGHRCEFLTDGYQLAAAQLEPGQLNSNGTLTLLRSRGVDTVVVYGTNLIRPPLLEEWGGRIINLHLGLSPYYRGTATNFYPLLNEEPEYVGATVHVIDAGIDTGSILQHARPEITAGDGPHTIGCKTILAGVEALIDVVRRMEHAAPSGVPQWKPAGARMYLRKNYHSRQVVELYRKLEAGLIPRYLERVRQGGGQIPLVSADGLLALVSPPKSAHREPVVQGRG